MDQRDILRGKQRRQHKCVAFDNLRQTPGWKLLQDYMMEQTGNAFDALTDHRTGPEKRAYCMAQVNLVKDIFEMVGDEISVKDRIQGEITKLINKGESI